MTHYRTKCEIKECPCFGFPCDPKVHPSDLDLHKGGDGMIELESIERDGHTHLLFTLGNVTVEMSEREVTELQGKLEDWIWDGSVGE